MRWQVGRSAPVTFAHVSENGSVWDRGPQYPNIWPHPSGNPVDIARGTDPDPPVLADAAASPVAEPPPAVSSAPRSAGSPRARWSLPRLPTSFWLLTIGVMVLVFTIVCRAHGAEPVFVSPLPVASSTLATNPTPTSPPIVIPPTPSPSMVDDLTARAASASTTSASASASTTDAPTTTTVPPTTTTAPPTTTVPPTTTTVPPTTTTAPPTTTVPPTTTGPPPTTLEPTGPTVTIIGRVSACRFGPDCLIAGFTIERFDVQPTRYV